MLSSYDVESQQFAVLTGFELPEVAQQVYGAKVAGTTANSAILEWSTTQPEAGIITCTSSDNSSNEWNESILSPSGIESLSHTVQLTELTTSTAYSCIISVGDAPSASVQFNTSEQIDTMPPEVLNLDVQQLSGGSLKVTWYTSEEATESIEVNGQTFTGDIVALRKNHQMTITPNPILPALQQFTLTVSVLDASGNSNSSSLTFIILEDIGDSTSPIQVPDDSDCTTLEGDECETSSPMNGELIIGASILVVLLVGFALLRTRMSENEILDGLVQEIEDIE